MKRSTENGKLLADSTVRNYITAMFTTDDVRFHPVLKRLGISKNFCLCNHYRKLESTTQIVTLEPIHTGGGVHDMIYIYQSLIKNRK